MKWRWFLTPRDGCSREDRIRQLFGGVLSPRSLNMLPLPTSTSTFRSPITSSPVKQDTAADERILPASALAEVLVAPMRRDPRDAEKVDQALAAVGIPGGPPPPEV